MTSTMRHGEDQIAAARVANGGSTETGEFNLVKYFSWVCFVVFVVVTAVMCTGFYQISKHYIRIDAEHHSIRIAERLASLAFADGGPFPAPGTDKHATSDEKMRDLLGPCRVFKIQIYDATGQIVYSTDPKIQVGGVVRENDKLGRALAGQVVSDLQIDKTVWDVDTQEDVNCVVVETYIPVAGGAPTDAAEGVVEISRDVRDSYGRLPGLIALIVGASVLAMGALYGVLYLVIRRADRIIRAQTHIIQGAKADIEKHASELERRVEERTKQLRETLAEQRHDEKMVATGTLAAGVAHELNTPLGSILGSAQLVLDHCSSAVGDGSEEIDATDAPAGCRPCVQDLSRIVSETRRCREIIRDLVGFSRKSDGKRSWKNLQELVEQGIALVEPEARLCRVIVEMIVADTLPPVRVNGNEIQQVLVNVMNNGIAAMPDGGALTVRLLRRNQRARIEIQDTGIGMDDVTLERIFEPFFTTKEVGKGTGLGLSISYRIIKDYGGSIFALSALNEGSTFIIEIPLDNADPEACHGSGNAPETT